MSALDYSRRFDAATEYNLVLLHPVGRRILERAGALPVDEVERYAMTGTPLALALATAPKLFGDAEAQEGVIAELAALSPSDPTAHRRPDPESTPLRTAGGDRHAAEWTAAVGVYDRFELTLRGPADGSPYLDIDLGAMITGPAGTVRVPGFVDGDGIFRVRFMPTVPGHHAFTTFSSLDVLDGHSGSFEVVAATAGRHGPVRADGFHFRHDDGTPYLPIGTTAYGWLHQDADRRSRTVATLRTAGFSKLRMCLFPKWFAYNEREPLLAPFAIGEDGQADLERPDPAFWSELERRVDELAEMGIEAELVLFHPYDRWGFEDMGPAADDRYVRYSVARLASFANVWWSLANEYDVMPMKDVADWERMAAVIVDSDPVGHLRSIHHCLEFYDHGRPWVTHASIQSMEVEKVGAWRERWGKPIVIDECGYEGDLRFPWGNITGEELTRRHWEAAVRGGYAGHGETFAHPEEEIWWSTGGDLRGESPERIRFLRDLMAANPGRWEPAAGFWLFPTTRAGDEVLISYLGASQSREALFVIDPSRTYTVDVIDTWGMTVETVARSASGRITVPLPARPWLAVRFTAEITR